MGSTRTNVGAVRSMQVDRGASIRTFRKANEARRCRHAEKIPTTSDCAAFSCHTRQSHRQGSSQDTSTSADADDTNGKRYAQALDRLTSFKSRLKKRIWQDHRKIDWQEEDAHLRRASKGLTKAIHDMLESFKWRDCCDGMAPAWGDSGSTGQNKSEFALGNQRTNMGAASSPSPRALGDPEAEARELEALRLADLQSDVSHIQEVRALVAEFVGKGGCGKSHTAASAGLQRPSQLAGKGTMLRQHDNSCAVGCASTEEARLGQTECASTEEAPLRQTECEESTEAAQIRQQTDCSQAAVVVENVSTGSGDNTMTSSLLAPPTADGSSRRTGLGSQAALVAQLLVQARTEQNKAGAHLAEAARTLEAEAEESRKAVAAVLALDRAEVYSSTQAWVLDKIGIDPSDENSTPSGRDHWHGGAEFANAGGLREKEVPGRVGVVQEAVMLAEVSHRLGMLETKHAARLATLRDEFLRDAAGPTSAGSAEAALDKNGGWPAERHFRFMKVVKAYTGTGSGVVSAGGLGRPDGKFTLTKRLADELAGVPAAEISRHESWHRSRGVYLARKKAEKQVHARELDELIALGKEALDELRKEEIQSAARADELREHERRRAELDELLEKQRGERELRARLAREQKEQALLEKAFRDNEEAERKAIEDARKRDAVAEYRASLEELRGREAEVREAAARAAEAERVRRMPKNRARVGFREERAREKRKEQERREQEAKIMEEKRLQVLEKLAASVPYAEACANAEAKLDHTTVATAAHFDQFLPFDRARGHCPMFGYNAGKVLKDTRFRLGLYLREAGLSGSAAAHSAVMRAVGPLRDPPF